MDKGHVPLCLLRVSCYEESIFDKLQHIAECDADIVDSKRKYQGFKLTFRHICRKVGLLMNKRGQETRKQIKKCACSLFAEKGFKQVTMKDICDVTELSRGGLYCHYESTRQIFQEIIDDMTSEQDNEMDLKIEQNCSAVTILDEILNKYENEMFDSQSSLSIAIYEYFSIRDIENQSNMLYEQYIISANTWKKLIQYGMDRHEFNEVDISAVFDLIVFSYQGVRMYSKLMPMDKETPSRIIKEIRKILVKRGSDTIPCDSCNKAV